jgi:magnesium transporter
MINTLFLPELREMLRQSDSEGLSEFCSALHPARTAEFMEGLAVDEAWAVLQFADMPTRVQLFEYFPVERQLECLRTQDRQQVARLVSEMSPDDRVDILSELEPDILEDLLERLPTDERRDFMRLSQYPEGTAGAVMTTEVAKLSENLTVREALNELGRVADEVETIYYLYVVDDEDHLRGLVSARQLVSAMKRPDMRLSELMDRSIVSVRPFDDQEEVADKVARLNILAIPVVDQQQRMLGIITHDDVIDVVREEATEDAHRSAAVEPLDETYLRTSILTLSWKRGIWLGILFFFALLTALALAKYEEPLKRWVWLVPFIPLVISCGGNSGSQSATLVITALSRGHVQLKDWLRIVLRELAMGLVLGGGLALLGYAVSLFFIPPDASLTAPLVVPLTLLLVVISGTLIGAVLPLLFEKLGWDPALMSNPFVAGIVDILGILIYVNVAFWLLGQVITT